MNIDDRLRRIETLLEAVLAGRPARAWYSVGEFARLVGRSPFTCREWCRLGRLAAVKKRSGRGAHPAWAISHDEFLRFQREGLRPAGPRLRPRCGDRCPESGGEPC